jgi:guanyl-specific ribonuclease Sa
MFLEANPMKYRKNLLLLLLCALLALCCTACSGEDVNTALGIAAALLSDSSQDEADDLTADTGFAAGNSASSAISTEHDTSSDAGTTTSGSGSQSVSVQQTPENWLDGQELDEEGTYSSQEDVAAYLVTYHHLPDNYITKREAEKLGWHGGSLEPYAPGKCIGGSRFGNYEGLLPEGETYYECDIDTVGAKKRGAQRLVYTEDFERVYYTSDHYESFTLVYGEEP